MSHSVGSGPELGPVAPRVVSDASPLRQVCRGEARSVDLSLNGCRPRPLGWILGSMAKGDFDRPAVVTEISSFIHAEVQRVVKGDSEPRRQWGDVYGDEYRVEGVPDEHAQSLENHFLGRVAVAVGFFVATAMKLEEAKVCTFDDLMKEVTQQALGDD